MAKTIAELREELADLNNRVKKLEKAIKSERSFIDRMLSRLKVNNMLLWGLSRSDKEESAKPTKKRQPTKKTSPTKTIRKKAKKN